jgi:DNA-binding transcriptional LysR family regulator
MLKPLVPRSVERVKPKTRRAPQLMRYGAMSTIPSLRKLEYLLAVAQELHFRKAAEKLHVSQPVVSRQVRQCEEEFGFRILERDHHYVALTRAGRVFVTDLGRILQHLEDDLKKAILKAAQTSRSPVPESVIGHSPFTTLRLRKIALDTGRKYLHVPGLRLRILPTSELLRAIKSKIVLAGITYAPIRDVDMETISIGHEYWAAVIPSSSRLVNGRVATIDQLKEQPIISNGADRTHPALNRQLQAEWAAVGFLPRIIAEVTSPHEAFDLVRDGIGIALLPEGVCHGLPHGVRAIRIADLPPLEAVLVCRRADLEFGSSFGEDLRQFLLEQDEGHSVPGPAPAVVTRKPVATQKPYAKRRPPQAARK